MLVGVRFDTDVLFWAMPDGLRGRDITTNGLDREPGRGPGPLEPLCNNGRNDDGDGLVDMADPG
jgi:hypothetical protein